MPLRIAAKVDPADQEYFEREIEPLLEQDHVDFIGEIGPDEKNDFLGNARALVFPIDWNEPFGLAMIESMACGTPVIAYRSGSVPEVIDEGVSGFIVDDIEGGRRGRRPARRDRPGRRARGLRAALHVARMARDYLEVYERLIAGWRIATGPS